VHGTHLLKLPLRLGALGDILGDLGDTPILPKLLARMYPPPLAPLPPRLV
jgi:hypothetical protein